MCGPKKAFLGLLVVFLSLVAALLFGGPAQAAAGINQQLSFEGKVVTSTGVNIPDGTYNMEFKVYQDGNSSGVGSTLKWTEDWLVGGSGGVTVTSGTFQVNLGAHTAFGASVDWNQDTLWLSFQVGNTSNCTLTTTFQSNCGGDGEMTPFIRLTAVPYALNANKVGGLTAAQLVQLTPGSTQTGTIDVSGNIKSGGQVQANTLDAATSGALTVGGTNATGITLVDNVTAGSGITVTLQATNALTLGSTTAAGGILFQDGTANNRTVTLAAPALTNSYSLAYATTGATGNQCLQSTSGSTSTVTALQWGSCGGGSTSLQNAYDATSGNTITTPNTGGARDLTVNLSDSSGTDSNFLVNVATNSTSKFAVQYNGSDTFSINNAASAQGSALFKNAANNTTAFQIQNAAGNALFVADTSNYQINQTGAFNNTGGATVGNLTTPAAPTVTNLGTAGTTSYTYAITARNANAGETLVSTGTVTTTGNATLSVTNFNRITWTGITGAKDYRIYRTASAGTPSTTGLIGTVTATATLTFDDTGIAGGASAPIVNTSGQAKFSGTFLAQNTSNSTTAFQVQNAAGTNMFTVDNTNMVIQVGSSTTDATGIRLVLDSYNNATDPTGTNGAMYYNSSSNKFRCFEASAWKDCDTTGGGGSNPGWAGVLHGAFGGGDPTSMNRELDVAAVAGPTPTGIGTTVARCVTYNAGYAITINKIRLYGVAATTNLYKFAIYPKTLGGSKLYDSGTVTSAANTWLNLTVGSVTLTANTDYLWCVTVVSTGTTAGFRSPASPIGTNEYGTGTFAATTPISGRGLGLREYQQFTVAAGTFPAVLPALAAASWTTTTGTIPIAFFDNSST